MNIWKTISDFWKELIIMILKKNSKVFIFCFALLFLISCKSKGNEDYKKECVANSALKQKEWFNYIDSVHTYPITKNKCIDSISLYFMKVNTPNVIAKSKYIFWKGSVPMKNGEFNIFIPKSNYQFFIVSNGKRNLILQEIEVNSSSIKESKKVILDLNDDNSLKDPCNQISNVEKKVVNQNIVLKIEIFQSCFDEYFFKELIYPIPLDLHFEKAKSYNKNLIY